MLRYFEEDAEAEVEDLWKNAGTRYAADKKKATNQYTWNQEKFMKHCRHALETSQDAVIELVCNKDMIHAEGRKDYRLPEAWGGLYKNVLYKSRKKEVKVETLQFI